MIRKAVAATVLVAASLLPVAVTNPSPAGAVAFTSPTGWGTAKPYGAVSYQIVGTGRYVDYFHGIVTNLTSYPAVAEIYVTGPDYVSGKEIIPLPPCAVLWPWLINEYKEMTVGVYWATIEVSGAFGTAVVQMSFQVKA
jgi:hypothetical protein